MFHLTHGLFFEKLPDGWVRLTKRETEDPKSAMVFQVAMDKAAWASVVDAMADGPVNPPVPIEESKPESEGASNESS